MQKNHQSPLARFYSNHPDALSRAHRSLLGGIHDEAVAYAEEHPEVAHHPGFEDVRNLPPNKHLEAVKRLREGESSGPEGENSDTDGFLGLKLGASKMGRREYQSSMRREARAELKR